MCFFFCFLQTLQNWEVMNTAVLTGRQVSQAMKVFIVSQAGTVADVTLQSSCHSEDESVLKVSKHSNNTSNFYLELKVLLLSKLKKRQYLNI